MKKTLFICILLLLGSSTTFAQKSDKKDRLRFSLGTSVSILILPMTGQMDVGDGIESTVNNQLMPKEPVYQVKDTTGILGGLYLHGVLVLPFYQQKSWSTGLKASAGIGRHTSMRAADGLTSLVYDFPQYLYYRNYASGVDFSVLAGYKYTMAPLSFHMLLGGLEFHLQNQNSIQLYGSLLSNKYYRYYTNGVTEEVLKATEVGAILNFYF